MEEPQTQEERINEAKVNVLEAKPQTTSSSFYQEPKKAKKKYILFGAIGIIILILGSMFISASSSATTAALLYIEEGNVEIDKGDGWEAAQDQMQLKNNY